MAVLVACGVNAQGQREVLAVEPMMEESRESYSQLFQSLKQRGLETPLLVVSDANKGLIAAIRERVFPVLPGSGVRYILCGTFWLMYPRRRKIFSRHS
jgi:transposase-like protein